jgi:hypothetical protein
VPVPFHLDEHISTALADALRHRGIDVTTTADAGLVGAADLDHLVFATARGRVLITQDIDFLRLHAAGVSHAGIAYCHPQSRSIGEMLRRLVLIHAALSPEDMKNRVEFL